jgi:hypothetical protein
LPATGNKARDYLADVDPDIAPHIRASWIATTSMEANEEGGADVESSFPASVLGAGSSTFWLKLNGAFARRMSFRASTVTSSGPVLKCPCGRGQPADKHAR